MLLEVTLDVNFYNVQQKNALTLYASYLVGHIVFIKTVVLGLVEAVLGYKSYTK